MSDIILKDKELDRLLLIKQVQDRKLTQKEASDALGLSDRQIRRLLVRVKAEGFDGIKGQHKGGNRSFKEEFKQKVLSCVRQQYVDFGPTFASEKLEDSHGLKVNRETLRHWMMEAGLWKGRTRKKARIHQSRERRSRFGELVQIDGSHHDWFEGRAPKCCLLVFIDDATGRILGLRFDKSETTLGYMKVITDYVETYGRPLAYYSDKHGIFKTTRENSVDGRLQDTQLHRALRELSIELICAHSSQAKGRVERANQTLQDRLIKEMRLKGISSMEEGNRYASEFMADYNKRFSVSAANSQDAHRPLHQEKPVLRRILSVHSQRKLSKNLEISFETKTYQIKTQTTGYRLRHKQVMICEHTDNSMEILCDGKSLEYKTLAMAPRIKEADCKEINGLIDELVEIGKTSDILSVLSTGSTAPAQLSY